MLLFVAVIVLYLYEFTLLSNIPKALTICLTVLYLYEFTLLSNHVFGVLSFFLSYTSMNLHYSQTSRLPSLIPNASYTSMNLHYSQTLLETLQTVEASYTSMNLHYSQTNI